MCGAILLMSLFNINLFSKCYGIINPIRMENSSREEIITHYFHSGLSYTEIISFLFVYHGIQITLRQLNRILRKLGLFCRKFKASITSVISAIQTDWHFYLHRLVIEWYIKSLDKGSWLPIEKLFELLWDLWILRARLLGPATDYRDVFTMLEIQIMYGI